MGYGDEIMASGLAKGAFAKGQRIAFGNGTRIIWHQFAHEIFRNNPNVAAPGQESAFDLRWIANYPGSRPYNRHFGNRWLWIPGHNDKPGEIYFDDAELAFAEKVGKDFVVIEPNVPSFKSILDNKQWPVQRYNEVAHHLVKAGYEPVQLIAPAPFSPMHRLQQARHIKTPTFRHALAILARASLFIGPEGGLHHGAAALGKRAVVLFGGFISPRITGYSSHRNIFTGKSPCGSLVRCEHCIQALKAISIEQVCDSAFEELNATFGNLVMGQEVEPDLRRAAL